MIGACTANDEVESDADIDVGMWVQQWGGTEVTCPPRVMQRRQIGRQADRQTARQVGRYVGRQAGR